MRTSLPHKSAAMHVVWDDLFSRLPVILLAQKTDWYEGMMNGSSAVVEGKVNFQQGPFWRAL